MIFNQELQDLAKNHANIQILQLGKFFLLSNCDFLISQSLNLLKMLSSLIHLKLSWKTSQQLLEKMG